MVKLKNNSGLRRSIVKAMATNTPFSTDDIDLSYERLGSFDRVIEFMDCASASGFSTISDYVDFYFVQEKRSGRLLD